nr:MAG TPA: hypothetical protein [Caudoviricetes sp.]
MISSVPCFPVEIIITLILVHVNTKKSVLVKYFHVDF